MHPTCIQKMERIMLPRSLVGRQASPEAWRHELGAIVDWDGEEWKVTGRSRSYAGREIYEVNRPGDGRPVRSVDGSRLSQPAQPVLLVA